MADKISGSEIVARIATLEGFVRILIHDMLKRDPKNSTIILDALSKAARASASTFPENKEMKTHNIIHTDDFLESIQTELGATK